ncbi:MAG TPA: hypothetical protein PLG43_15385, partial [Spirochaetia bacterium]|nr:hypothetical protein [Spirochaetia bacterium]
TPGLLKAELLASKRSFTLGVEGISSRMRAFLHKGLTEETVCAVVKRLFTEGVREIKFFFILTGHEEEADRDEFGRFVKCVKKLRRDSGSQTRVIFSFGYLIRMLFTPLQFDELMLEYDSYHVIASSCKRDCETNGFEFRLAMNFDEYCFSQVLALIGPGGASLLTACAERDFVYDSYLSRGGWEFARTFLTEGGFLSDEFIGQKGLSYCFPLEWIKGVPEKRYLYRQYESCLAFSEGSSCFEANSARESVGALGDSASFEGGCPGCGACRDADEKRAILSHTIHLPQSAEYWTELSTVIKEKQKIAPLFCEIHLPAETAGACPEWKSAFIMRKLFEAMPSEVSNLLYADDVLSQNFQRRFGAYHGYT